MIVLVEDDLSIQKLVSYALEMNGFSVACFSSGEEALKCDEDNIQLYILDIMLPGLSGLEILSHIRGDKRTRDIPVILLTAKSTELDKVTGLDSGADDYITKPFGVLELISRVKALLRRTTPTSEVKAETIKDGELVINLKEHRVYLSGKVVDLTLKEFDLLEYLLRNKGRAIDRDLLLKDVWGYNYCGESRTIDVHVRHLREKLGEFGNKIETVKGIGYRYSDEDEK